MVLDYSQPRSTRYCPYSRSVLATDQSQAIAVAPAKLETYKIQKAEELRALFTPAADTFNPISTTSLRAARAATGYHDRQEAASWRTIGLLHLGDFTVTDTTPSEERIYQFVWSSRDPVQDSPNSDAIHSSPTVKSCHESSASGPRYSYTLASEHILASPTLTKFPDPSDLVHSTSVGKFNHDLCSSTPISSTVIPSYDLPYTLQDLPATESDNNSSTSIPESSPTTSPFDPHSIHHISRSIEPMNDSSAFSHALSSFSPSHDTSTPTPKPSTLVPTPETPMNEVRCDSPHIKATRRVSPRHRAGKALPAPTGLSYRVVSSILKKVYVEVVYPQRREIIKCSPGRLDQTYGEMMPSLIENLLAIVRLDSNSLCIDLGSGIGNVVIQMSMRTGCRSVGIECVETRARVAQEQLEVIRRLLGKKVGAMGAVELLKGDMLKNKMLKELMGKADLVLVNNLKFDASLNHHISNMLRTLKVGAYVVSLEELDVSLRGSKASARDEDSLGSRMSISRRPYAKNGVSWKYSAGTYRLHVMEG